MFTLLRCLFYYNINSTLKSNPLVSNAFRIVFNTGVMTQDIMRGGEMTIYFVKFRIFLSNFQCKSW